MLLVWVLLVCTASQQAWQTRGFGASRMVPKILDDWGGCRVNRYFISDTFGPAPSRPLEKRGPFGRAYFRGAKKDILQGILGWE